MKRRWLLSLVVAGQFAAASAAAPPPLVLILDASGSMWGQISGEAKIVGARKVVGELIKGLEPGRPVGLVAYGHRREADCADIETLVPLAPLDAARFSSVLEKIQPKGKTPITAALRHGVAVAPPGSTVVLVTDGLETCAADPCAAVRAARPKGDEFVLHVIGFDVAKEDVSSLECSAQAGGGSYLPAADAAELAEALKATAAAPVATSASLILRATRNGALQDAAVVVKAKKGDAERTARTYARPETNPRQIPLTAGTYSVRVKAVGVEGDTERSFDIELGAGDRVEREIDFSTGELVLGATRNGALSDVLWQLFAPGDRKRAVATGRTYGKASTNPDRVTVPAGDYDLVLKALEIAGRPEMSIAGVKVTPQAPARVDHSFASADLRVEVVRGAALVDAVVAVHAKAAGSKGAALDQSRSYKSPSSNPVRFVVEPGSYVVEVTEVKGERRSFEVTLTAGEVTARTIDLSMTP